MVRSGYIMVLCLVLLFCAVPVSAGSVNYNFRDSIPEGIVVEGVPASLVDNSLKMVIDASSQTWTAKVLVAVNQDIFDNPVMVLRYKVGTPVAGTTGNIPVTLQIDDIYTQNGD